MAHYLGLAAWLCLALNALLGARHTPGGCEAVLLHGIAWVAFAHFLQGLGG